MPATVDRNAPAIGVNTKNILVADLVNTGLIKAATLGIEEIESAPGRDNQAFSPMGNCPEVMPPIFNAIEA